MPARWPTDPRLPIEPTTWSNVPNTRHLADVGPICTRVAPQSARPRVVPFRVPPNFVPATVKLKAGATASVGLVHSWAAVYSPNLASFTTNNKMRVVSADVTGEWLANTDRTFSFRDAVGSATAKKWQQWVDEIAYLILGVCATTSVNTVQGLPYRTGIDITEAQNGIENNNAFPDLTQNDILFVDTVRDQVVPYFEFSSV